MPFSTSDLVVSEKVVGVDRGWRLRASQSTEAECPGDLYNGYMPGFDGDEEWSFDVAAIEGLFQIERDELSQLGYRYLVIRSGQSNLDRESVKKALSQLKKEKIVKPIGLGRGAKWSKSK